MHCTDLEKARILALWQQGESFRSIGRIMDRDKNTIRKWIRRFQIHGNTNKRPRSLGLTKCTTEQQDKDIVNFVRSNPITDSSKILLEVNSLNCSGTTIKRRLASTGIKCHRPAKNVDFTNIHAEARMEFAVRHLYMDWTNVIFSDEKTFRSNENNHRLVYRTENTRFIKENVVKNKSSGRIHGAGNLVLIDNKLTSRKYIEILENHLLPLVAANGGETIQFVQDNSAVHTARIVQEWFEEYPEIEKVEWPTKSPDLNPTENLWEWDIQLGIGQTIYIDMLRQHVEASWTNINRDYCASLVNSMQRRLFEVVAVGGYYTKY